MRFTLLKASLFPGFNPITPVFKSRVAYPGFGTMADWGQI
jgi:hypothetical protein